VSYGRIGIEAGPLSQWLVADLEEKQEPRVASSAEAQKGGGMSKSVRA
jgi:hypothetical protein